MSFGIKLFEKLLICSSVEDFAGCKMNDNFDADGFCCFQDLLQFFIGLQMRKEVFMWNIQDLKSNE